MGYGANELSVLDDRAAGKSLDDAAGQGDEVRVCDFDAERFLGVFSAQGNFFYLDGIVEAFAADARPEQGFAGLDLADVRHFHPGAVPEGFATVFHLAEDAADRIVSDDAQIFFRNVINSPDKLAGIFLLAFGDGGDVSVS